MVMSSKMAPSTVSSAKPWHFSKTQFDIVMFLNPPFDSVPNLMRPVPQPPLRFISFHVPSSTLPSSYPPVTKQLEMVTFSVARASPSAYELLGTMPSSQGEFTVQLETRTLRQQSMSMPSRLVSIFRLSMVRLSTPVARMPNHPPCRMEKSLRSTLRQFLSAMALLPTPLCQSVGQRRPFRRHPRLNPLPQISPGPKMPKSVRCSRPRSASCASGCARSPGRAPTRPAARPRHIRRHAVPGVGAARMLRAMVQVERHLALQPDRVAQVDAGREDHRAAASRCRRVNRAIDRGRVNVRSVAFCPKPAHVEVPAASWLPGSWPAIPLAFSAVAAAGAAAAANPALVIFNKSLRCIIIFPQSSIRAAGFSGPFAHRKPARPLCHIGAGSRCEFHCR